MIPVIARHAIEPIKPLHSDELDALLFEKLSDVGNWLIASDPPRDPEFSCGGYGIVFSPESLAAKRAYEICLYTKELLEFDIALQPIAHYLGHGPHGLCSNNCSFSEVHIQGLSRHGSEEEVHGNLKRSGQGNQSAAAFSLSPNDIPALSFSPSPSA